MRGPDKWSFLVCDRKALLPKFPLLVGTLNNFDIFEVVPTHKSWKEQKIFTLHEDVTPGWLYL